jgi:hypothetical protein
MRARLLFAAMTFAVVGTTASRSYGADVQACLAASEKGQRARGTGKLREARESFLVCQNEGCPAIVRRDCAQWTGELTQALPTIVFGAKDKAGRDLFDVTVSIDGEVLTKKLDGKAIFVDPGPHTFKFETTGAQPVAEKVLVKEGEKSRGVTITFDIGEPPHETGGGGGGGGGNGGGGTGGGNGGGGNGGGGRGVDDGGHSALPWVVVGIGAAGVITGIVIVATTPNRPENCSADTQTCTRRANQSEADFKADQEQAGKADSQPVLGFAIAGIGGALVLGGLLWHFLEPTDSKSARPRITPWVTGQSSGAALGGAF